MPKTSANPYLHCIQAGMAVLFLAASFANVHATSQPQRVALTGSIKEVETWTQPGPPDPKRPLITRTTLTSSEVSAPMDFEVALKMRDFAELEARLARGEHISLQEMQAKYDPLPADEKAMAGWLTGQGFSITRRSADRLAVFASGSVAQIQKAMQVNFGKVSHEGKEYTSAITVPSLPSNLSTAVLGVNGLQPYIRPHKHVIAKPNSLTGTNPPFLPSQIAKADDATGLYSSTITGAGQAIAIVIDTFPLKSDLTSFWSTYGVNQSINNISFIQVVSGTLPATSEEETLDTEWSSSIAPGAKVRVYAAVSLNSVNLDQAYEQVFTDATTQPQLGIHQMSMSYGGVETSGAKSQLLTDSQYFASLASAGVTCFASSGDSASTPGSGGNEDTSGVLAAESPASDVNVTGVGGTSLTLDSNGNASSETAWSYSGGGASIIFSRPSWQTGTGVPTGTARMVPDVACPADPYTGAVLFYNGSQTLVGGTSWSSPTWAGYCALINQARANAALSSLGLLGPYIYPVLNSPNYNSNFRDITSGGNDLGVQSDGNYVAGTGYDPVTGIGVPLVQTLAQTLVGTPPPPQVQIAPAFQDIAPGQNATITVSFTGSPVSYQWQRIPIGTTTWRNLSDNGTYSGSATASLTVNGATAAMSGDQFQCVVTYAGPSSVTSLSSSLVVDTPFTIINIAGSAGSAGNVNGTGSGAKFNYPSGSAVDSFGNLYIADYSNNCIRKVTTANVVSTPYGSTTGSSGSFNARGNNARFNGPNAIVADSSNNLYVADSGNNSIRKITTSGVVSTLASGFNAPNGIAIDGAGNFYVADSGNNVIKKVTSSGSVSTLAGNSGNAGYVNGTGTAAEFNNPASVAVDNQENVYVADLNNDVVRKITSAGVVTLFAGQPGAPGYVDGLSANAAFNSPGGVAVDGSNNVYVTDSLVPPIGSVASGNNLLRRISTSGVVSTIAGQPGVTGSASGTGTAAQFYSLQSATFNSAGEIFLADTYNQLVRAGGIVPTIVTPPLGQVITIGQPVTFSVAASGTGPLTYQWLDDSAGISGATGSSYSIASVAAGNAGNYGAMVTNAFGNVTSTTATLIPVNSQPVAQSVTVGDTVTFSISVAGPGPYAYQWLLNGGAISGATNSSYTIPVASSGNAGSYSVVVSDANGVATTIPVSLTVNPPDTNDTPVMPPWGMALLAALLFFVATRRKLLIR